jgi:hypothetical protein
MIKLATVERAPERVSLIPTERVSSSVFFSLLSLSKGERQFYIPGQGALPVKEYAAYSKNDFSYDYHGGLHISDM